jgi:hypothetical protein
MDSKSKIDHCRYLIGRYDQYMDGVNSKVAFYLGINTFILGGICVGYNSCKDCPHTTTYSILLVVTGGLLLCCLGSILFTIRAVAPYLKDNDNNDDKTSLLFFGGIAKYNSNDFQLRFNSQDEESLLTDFIRQTHSMAKGLNKKFQHLKTAAQFLTAEYVLLIIVILLTFSILN